MPATPRHVGTSISLIENASLNEGSTSPLIVTVPFALYPVHSKRSGLVRPEEVPVILSVSSEASQKAMSKALPENTPSKQARVCGEATEDILWRHVSNRTTRWRQQASPPTLTVLRCI